MRLIGMWTICACNASMQLCSPAGCQSTSESVHPARAVAVLCHSPYRACFMQFNIKCSGHSPLCPSKCPVSKGRALHAALSLHCAVTVELLVAGLQYNFVASHRGETW